MTKPQKASRLRSDDAELKWPNKCGLQMRRCTLCSVNELLMRIPPLLTYYKFSKLCRVLPCSRTLFVTAKATLHVSTVRHQAAHFPEGFASCMCEMLHMRNPQSRFCWQSLSASFGVTSGAGSYQHRAAAATLMTRRRSSSLAQARVAKPCSLRTKAEPRTTQKGCETPIVLPGNWQQCVHLEKPQHQGREAARPLRQETSSEGRA